MKHEYFSIKRSRFTEIREDYWTKNLDVVYQGVRFFRRFDDQVWFYKSDTVSYYCTTDMSSILQETYNLYECYSSQFQYTP